MDSQSTAHSINIPVSFVSLEGSDVRVPLSLSVCVCASSGGCHNETRGCLRVSRDSPRTGRVQRPPALPIGLITANEKLLMIPQDEGQLSWDPAHTHTHTYVHTQRHNDTCHTSIHTQTHALHHLYTCTIHTHRQTHKSICTMTHT